MKTLFRHYLSIFLLAFSMLLYTPAQGEMTISGTSNLDTLDYDLDSIHLKLEKEGDSDLCFCIDWSVQQDPTLEDALYNTTHVSIHMVY